MRIQIYVALIAFMLLRILHQTAARSVKVGTALLLAQLKISLFRPHDLRRTAKPRPGPQTGDHHIRNSPWLSNDHPLNQNPGHLCAKAGTQD